MRKTILAGTSVALVSLAAAFAPVSAQQADDPTMTQETPSDGGAPAAADTPTLPDAEAGTLAADEPGDAPGDAVAPEPAAAEEAAEVDEELQDGEPVSDEEIEAAVEEDAQPTGQLQAEAVPPATSVTVEEVLDAEVLDLRGDEIASVTEVIAEPDGTITHVVVSYGGFMGIGTKEVMLPWQTVRYDSAEEFLQIQGNEADLDAAPAYVARADYDAEKEAEAERRAMEAAPEPDGIPNVPQTPEEGATEGVQ